MERITYRKTLDVHKNGVQFTLQGFETADKLSRVIEISLMASGDAIDFPLESMVALMYVTTPGAEEPSIIECTIKDNKVVYEVLPIVEEGLTTMQLKLIETSPEGATSVLASPKFAVEVTKSDADDESVEQTTTFTALEDAVARAKDVYDGRFLRMELTSDCIFKAYYAGANDDHGAIYETDILKKLFNNGNVLMSESFAHGGTGVRTGEDTDNSMYYSNVSKSEALNAKSIMENSVDILEEVKLHGMYTAFSVDFETGEVQYVSPSYEFKVNKETGHLDTVGQSYTFDAEIYRVLNEWLATNSTDLIAVKTATDTHTEEIADLKEKISTHTESIFNLVEDVTELKEFPIPIEKGGTGATSIEEFLGSANLHNFIETYQKPWNLDGNVGNICINALNGALVEPDMQIFTPKFAQYSLIMINSGNVLLCFDVDITSTILLQSHIDIDILVNDDLVYKKSSKTDTILSSYSVELDVKKGDSVIIKYTVTRAVYGDSKDSMSLKNIHLEANIETPYKYIDLI